MISQVAFFSAFVALFSVTSGDGHDYHAPQPYSFGYNVKDHHGEKHREESGDGHGNVKGSYGFSDDRGVHRQVNYVADHGGFRAVVKTNEKGTANQDPAAVNMVSSAPYAGAVGSGYGAARLGNDVGYDGLGYGRVGYGSGLGYGGLGYGAGLGYGGLGYGYDDGRLGYGYNDGRLSYGYNDGGLGGYGRGMYNLGNGGVVYGLGYGGYGGGYGMGYGGRRYAVGY